MTISKYFLDRIRENDASLTKLDLSGLDLADPDITELCAALAQNTHLIKLNLSRNNIGMVGAGLLAQNTRLIELDLKFSKIGAAGAHALAQNTTLTCLELRYNNIGDDGAYALAQNTTLTWLNVPDNNIGNAGMVALNNMLSRNQMRAAEARVQAAQAKVQAAEELSRNQAKVAEKMLLARSLLARAKEDTANPLWHNEALAAFQEVLGLLCNNLEALTEVILILNIKPTPEGDKALVAYIEKAGPIDVESPANIDGYLRAVGMLARRLFGEDRYLEGLALYEGAIRTLPECKNELHALKEKMVQGIRAQAQSLGERGLKDVHLYPERTLPPLKESLALFARIKPYQTEKDTEYTTVLQHATSKAEVVIAEKAKEQARLQAQTQQAHEQLIRDYTLDIFNRTASLCDKGSRRGAIQIATQLQQPVTQAIQAQWNSIEPHRIRLLASLAQHLAAHVKQEKVMFSREGALVLKQSSPYTYATLQTSLEGEIQSQISELTRQPAYVPTDSATQKPLQLSQQYPGTPSAPPPNYAKPATPSAPPAADNEPAPSAPPPDYNQQAPQSAPPADQVTASAPLPTYTLPSFPAVPTTQPSQASGNKTRKALPS